MHTVIQRSLFSGNGLVGSLSGSIVIYLYLLELKTVIYGILFYCGNLKYRPKI